MDCPRRIYPSPETAGMLTNMETSESRFLPRWKRYLFSTVVTLVAVVVSVVSVVAFRSRGGVHWGAGVQMDYYDCSAEGFCRLQKNTTIRERDVNGNYNEIAINSLGFRGPDPVPDTEDIFSVQVYGDSMVFGTGVADGKNLPRHLERALEEVTGSAQVTNFGLPMNYLRSNLLVYEEFGEPYDPDLLVFAWSGATGNPRDMNFRLKQIQNSPVLSWLTERPWGLWLVNEWQVSTHYLYSDAAAKSLLHRLSQPLIDAQQERGVQVIVFSWWSDVRPPEDLFPEELDVTYLASDITFDDYRASDYCIQGDGHPTPEGHAYFASVVMGGIAVEASKSPGG